MKTDENNTASAPGKGWAISSFVLAVLSLVALPLSVVAMVLGFMLPLAVVALMLGIIALAKGQSKGLAISGVVLGGLISSFVVFVALQGLLEDRVAATQSAAASHLKASIFPAQFQFQEGKHLDEDKNGVGEYGFITEMSGAESVQGQEGIRLSFLPKIWDTNEPLVYDYRFALYLPDGSGAASSRAGITDHSPAAITAREKQWIAYAWPEPWGKNGRRAFAITSSGTVLSTKSSDTGGKPAWNAAFSNGWGSAPSAEWTPYRR